MDGKLSQTELSSFELLSIFDLASCFFHTKSWLLHSNHVLCSLETKNPSHLISYHIFVSKIAYKASSLRVPNLVTKIIKFLDLDSLLNQGISKSRNVWQIHVVTLMKGF